MKLRAEAAVEPDTSLEIKELTVSQLERMLDVMYLSRADIRRRFGGGERCFAVMNDTKIAAYFWARFIVRRIDDLFLEFKLRPNQAWFYNAITVKSARGKGYYPNIIRYMAKALRAEGFDEFFIDAEEGNQPSIRGMEKAGCNRVAKIQMKKLFSKIRYNVIVFDKTDWQQFSEVVKGPHHVKN